MMNIRKVPFAQQQPIIFIFAFYCIYFILEMKYAQHLKHTLSQFLFLDIFNRYNKPILHSSIPQRKEIALLRD